MNRTIINKSDWSDAQIRAAKEIWKDYESRHDLSDRHGQTAGIDPVTGEVWLGADVVDIGKQCREQGLATPLFFVRIGYPTVYRKGGRR